MKNPDSEYVSHAIDIYVHPFVLCYFECLSQFTLRWFFRILCIVVKKNEQKRERKALSFAAEVVN